MKITADSNLLVRVMVRDDMRQLSLARAALDDADLVAVSTSALCEVVWVLHRYKHTRATIAATIRALVDSANVVTDRLAVDAGLAMLDDNGDFADGVIAYEGRALGADEFVSFDGDAVKRLIRRGYKARAI